MAGAAQRAISCMHYYLYLYLAVYAPLHSAARPGSTVSAPPWPSPPPRDPRLH